MTTGAKAISSMTRALKGKVKLNQMPTNHPLASKGQAMVPASGAVAAHGETAAAHHDHYAWGVKWTGHQDTRTMLVDTSEIKKAFQTWHKFSLGGRELMEVVCGLGSVMSNALPAPKGGLQR